jgi:hypothetical protein
MTVPNTAATNLSLGTWFRCLVKLLNEAKDGAPSSDEARKGYVWYEMGFFTHWNREHYRLLCVDTPMSLQLELKNVLQSQSAPLDLWDPFALYAPLIDQIIVLCDKSVWRIRNPIRDIEMVCLSITLMGIQQIMGLIASRTDFSSSDLALM